MALQEAKGGDNAENVVSLREEQLLEVLCKVGGAKTPDAVFARVMEAAGLDVRRLAETRNFAFKVYLVREGDEEEVSRLLRGVGVPFALTRIEEAGLVAFIVAVPRGEEALLERVMGLFKARELRRVKADDVVEVRIDVSESRLLEVLCKIGEAGILHPAEPSREALRGKLGERIARAIEHLDRLCDRALRSLNAAVNAGFRPKIGEDGYCLPKPVGSLEDYLKALENELDRFETVIASAVAEVQELRDYVEKAAANAVFARVMEAAGLDVRRLAETRNFAFKVYLVREGDEEEVSRLLRGVGVPFALTRIEEAGLVAFIVAVPRGEEALLERVMGLFKARELRGEGPIVRYSEKGLLALTKQYVEALRRTRLLNKLEAYARYVESLRRLLAAVRVEGRRYVLVGYTTREGYNLLKKIIGHRDVRVGWLPPERSAPVVRKYPRLMGAFEVILGMYGVPARGEVDPMPVIFVTFPLFFGFMFGDIGQGAVLALVGLYLMLKTKYKNWGVVLLMCGAWSVFFGALYGELFGYSLHELFHVHAPLALHGEEGLNADTVKRLLGIAILAGIVHVALAITIRGVNHLREGHIIEAVTRDFVLLAFYLVGVVLVASLQLGLLGIDAKILLNTLGILAVVFVFGEPVLLFAKGERREASSSLFDGLIEFMISILELTANSLSYARLAVIALVHTALMLIVVSSASAGPLISIPIQVIGNIGVMALEGLVAFVQSLRLNFYEFMSKFFSGEGRKYQPVVVRFREKAL